MTKTVTTPSQKPEPLAILEDSLVSLASHFVEMTEKEDRATGELVQVNVMAFTQRRILNGVAYSMELQLKSTEQSLDKAANELRALMRSYRGDEISKKNVESKQAFIERLILQRETLQAAFEVARRVHLNVTGEAYLDADSQRAERARKDDNASALPELQGAAKLLATLGIKESAHPAKSMDRLDRSSAA